MKEVLQIILDIYHSTIRIINTKFYSTRIPDQQKSDSITKKIH